MADELSTFMIWSRTTSIWAFASAARGAHKARSMFAGLMSYASSGDSGPVSSCTLARSGSLASRPDEQGWLAQRRMTASSWTSSFISACDSSWGLSVASERAKIIAADIVSESQTFIPTMRLHELTMLGVIGQGASATVRLHGAPSPRVVLPCCAHTASAAVSFALPSPTTPATGPPG